MSNRPFAVEESKSTAYLVKDDITRAIYSGKFSEYIITKSSTLQNTLIVTDIFSRRDKIDIINSSIKELVFSDCVKKFDELYNQIFNGQSLKLEATQQSTHGFGSSYKFKEDIDFNDDIIREIKIVISGYNETDEKVSLDTQMLSKTSVYKYKISSNTIEISISACMARATAKELLKTFVYTKMSVSQKKARDIYVFINNKLLRQISIEL